MAATPGFDFSPGFSSDSSSEPDEGCEGCIIKHIGRFTVDIGGRSDCGERSYCGDSSEVNSDGYINIPSDAGYEVAGPSYLVRVVDHSMRATNSERGYTPQLLGDLTQGDGGWSPPVLRTRKDIYFHFGPM